MPYSYARQDLLFCPHCEAVFSADIWLIVDEAERLDLVEYLRNGTLHAVSCPRCGLFQGCVDAPLLIYRSHKVPTLIFSPAENMTAEQGQEEAAYLVGHLRAALGDAWQDDWITQGIIGVPRHLLPVIFGVPPEDVPHQPPEGPQWIRIPKPLFSPRVAAAEPLASARQPRAAHL